MVMSRSTVQKVSLAAGVALGVILLILAFRGAHPAAVITALAATDPRLVALGLVAVGATVVAKTFRWGLLFYPRHRSLRFSNLFSAIVIGQTMNLLLPARVGELGRAYLIGENEGQSKLFALGTIVVEKLLDGAMLLLVLALLFLVMPLPDWLRMAGATTGLALACLLVGILLLTGQRKAILAALERVGRHVPGMQRIGLPGRLEVLTDSLASLRAREVNVRLLTWSFAIWVLASLTNYLTLLALGIQVPLVVASLFILAVIHIGLVVPSSPGRIGVFHFLCVLSLSFFGVDAAVALAYGLVLHFIVVVPVIFVGLLCLWKENVTLYRLVREVGDR
jgi:uncharacterized protein (TIRG00374 family)